MVVSDCGVATLGGFSELGVAVRKGVKSGEFVEWSKVGRVKLKLLVAKGVVVEGGGVPRSPVRGDLPVLSLKEGQRGVKLNKAGECGGSRDVNVA